MNGRRPGLDGQGLPAQGDGLLHRALFDFDESQLAYRPNVFGVIE